MADQRSSIRHISGAINATACADVAVTGSTAAVAGWCAEQLRHDIDALLRSHQVRLEQCLQQWCERECGAAAEFCKGQGLPPSLVPAALAAAAAAQRAELALMSVDASSHLSELPPKDVAGRVAENPQAPNSDVGGIPEGSGLPPGWVASSPRKHEEPVAAEPNSAQQSRKASFRSSSSSVCSSVTCCHSVHAMDMSRGPSWTVEEDACGSVSMPVPIVNPPSPPVQSPASLHASREVAQADVSRGAPPRACTTLALPPDACPPKRQSSSLASTPRKTLMDRAFTDQRSGSMLSGPPERRNSISLLNQGRRSKSMPSPLSKHKRTVVEASQSALQRWTRSLWYKSLMALAIVLDTTLIAWRTEQRAASAAARASTTTMRQEMLAFLLISTVFCGVFCADLMSRLIAERSSFFQGRDRSWNSFDIVVVITTLFEVVVDWISFSTSNNEADMDASFFFGKFAMLRIVRLLRLIRTSSSLRLIRFIRELRLMVYSLFSSLTSLIWAVVLMLIVLLTFGIFFTDGVISHCLRTGSMHDEATAELRETFGNLSSATLSLYQAMSGGDDWANFMKPLEVLAYEYKLLYLTFITFAILALLNVITAVFVESAMQRSQNDREFVVQEEMENREELILIMQQVFNELDTNNSGALSLEEFERHIDDEKIVAYLSSLGLDVNQVRTLFVLLDVDQTGEVDIEEFVQGCLRLKGGAKSLDMAIIKYQVEWLVHHFSAGPSDSRPPCRSRSPSADAASVPSGKDAEQRWAMPSARRAN